MAPSNTWPPNTLYEWMVGQNLPRKKPKSKKPRTRSRLAFEVSTDDESGSDVYKLTLPAEKRDRSKKVRFVEETPRSGSKVPKEPLKPIPAEPAPEVGTDSGIENSANEGISDEEPDPDCPCTTCIQARKKLKQEQQAKNKDPKPPRKDTDRDDAKAVHAQHKAKKAKQAEEAKSKKAKQKNKEKSKKKQPEPETESEATEATDTEPETEESEEQSEKESEKESEDEKPKNKGNKKEKGKQNQKNNQKNKNDRKGGNKNKNKKSNDEGNKTASESEPEARSQSEPKPSPPKAGKKGGKKDKKVTLPPHHPPPEVRQGNFLLPPRSHILHVEHAVEAPDDPRPNAFYDNENGVMRVYHGPAYGNPYGALYPKRVYSHRPLPVGTPHPMYNPWYNGFQTVAGQPVPPLVPPNMPPQTPMQQMQAHQKESPDASRWFQGYGMTTTAAAPDMPPAPDFEAGFDKNKYEEMVEKYGSLSPRKSKERHDVWDSNVMPFPTIDGSPSPQQGSDRSKVSNQSNRSNKSKTTNTSGATKKMDTNKLWSAQSASGSKKGSENGSKKDDKVDATKAGGSYNSTSKLRKSLEETMAKDLAESKQREERWSNRSGSKEASPQPKFDQNTNTDGWGMTNNNTADNNNAWADNTWGDNGNDTNMGGGNTWGDNTNDAANAGTTWAYDNNDNNGGDAEASRVFEWVGDGVTTSKANNTDWDAKSTKSHKSNNGSPLKDANAESSTPVPGGWFSPPKTTRTLSNKPPSNASGGNVVGGGEGSFRSGKGGGNNNNNNNNNDTWDGAAATGGWGDPSAAQRTGGFWEEEARKENGKGKGKGKEKEKETSDRFGGASSSWW